MKATPAMKWEKDSNLKWTYATALSMSLTDPWLKVDCWHVDYCCFSNCSTTNLHDCSLHDCSFCEIANLSLFPLSDLSLYCHHPCSSWFLQGRATHGKPRQRSSWFWYWQYCCDCYWLLLILTILLWLFCHFWSRSRVCKNWGPGRAGSRRARGANNCVLGTLPVSQLYCIVNFVWCICELYCVLCR